MKKHLQNLIAGMTVSEKRNFKKESGQSDNGKLYLRLFDLLNHSPSCPDEKAGAKLGVKQVRVLRFRLYEQLLESLTRNFIQKEENRRPDISKVKLLLSKRLYEDALRLLEKQLKHAKETEDFFAVLELLDMRERLVRLNRGTKYNTESILAVHREKEKFIEIIRHIRQLETLFALLIQVRIEHTPDRTGKIPKLYARYLREFKDALDEKKLLTTNQKYLYYDVQFLKNDFENHVEKAITCSLQKIELHRSGLKAKVLTLSAYVACLNNHIILLSRNHRNEESLPFINLFRELKSADLNLQTHIFYASNVAWTNYLIIKREILFSESVIAAIENQFEKTYRRGHEKEMTLRYNIGLLYFRLNRFRKSKRIFYKLMTDTAPQGHIRFYAQVLFLISVFEMQEYDLFEKEADSFINSQKKKGEEYSFEIALFLRMKKLVSINAAPKSIRTELKKYYEKQAAVMLSGTYRQALDYFDFIRYLNGVF